MRTAPLAFILLSAALVGCASEKISVRPRLESEVVLGEGLDASFFVAVVSCGGFGDCTDNGSVSELAAEIDDEAIASLRDTRVSPSASFALRGEKAGTTSIELSTDIDAETYPVHVDVVAASRVLPLEPDGTLPALDLRTGAAEATSTTDTYRVLATSQLSVGQMHFDIPIDPAEPPPSDRLYGFASLQLNASTTDAVLDTSPETPPLLSAGAQLGVASVTTSVGGEMSLEVVDDQSVATLALVDSITGAHDASLQLTFTRELHLLPRATDGRWILGAGNSEPTVTSSDPAVVRVTHAGAGLTQRLSVEPIANGSASLTCEWLGSELVVGVEVAGL